MEIKHLTIGGRVLFIRKSLNLSRTAFGSTFGVSRDVINNIERNRVKNPDPMLRLISMTYDVSYTWLTDGLGDPYLKAKIITKEAVGKYELDAKDQKFIENFVKLNKESRNLIRNLLSSAFEKASD